jgi:hypothetical protein
LDYPLPKLQGIQLPKGITSLILWPSLSKQSTKR